MVVPINLACTGCASRRDLSWRLYSSDFGRSSGSRSARKVWLTPNGRGSRLSLTQALAAAEKTQRSLQEIEWRTVPEHELTTAFSQLLLWRHTQKEKRSAFGVHDFSQSLEYALADIYAHEDSRLILVGHTSV